MKRLFFVFLVLVVASCNKPEKEDSIKEFEEINKAKQEAVDSIRSAKDTAVSEATTEISSAIRKAIEGANNDLKSVIDAATDDIKSSVQDSVKALVDKKYECLNSEVAEAKRMSRITGWLALAAVLLTLGTIFYTIHLSKELRDLNDETVLRESIVRTIEDSSRIRRYFSGFVQSSPNKALTKEDVKLIVSQTLDSKSREVSSYHTSNNSSQFNPGNAGISGERHIDAKIELYAKDSSSDVLSGVQSTFQPGKSIYKLILANKEDREAELTLCLDEAVQRRILKSSDDFLSSVCNVERKSADPQSVTVSAMGRANKVSGDTWRVSNRISVILS